MMAMRSSDGELFTLHRDFSTHCTRVEAIVARPVSCSIQKISSRRTFSTAKSVCARGCHASSIYNTYKKLSVRNFYLHRKQRIRYSPTIFEDTFADGWGSSDEKRNEDKITVSKIATDAGGRCEQEENGVRDESELAAPIFAPWAYSDVNDKRRLCHRCFLYER